MLQFGFVEGPINLYFGEGMVFTGIVEEVGTLLSFTRRTGQQGYTATFSCTYSDVVVGESIAVNGVCLTVTRFESGAFSADLSPETLRVTAFGALLPEGDRAADVKQTGQQRPQTPCDAELNKHHYCHLERALCVGDRMGGHWLSGHVDQCARVMDVQETGQCLAVTVGEVHPDFRGVLVLKGSIAVNGVSLTINQVQSNGEAFTVMLIPHTLSATALRFFTPGDAVNVEYDMLAKMVSHQLINYKKMKERLECA